jgi:excisionase family DNA binding protein
MNAHGGADRRAGDAIAADARSQGRVRLLTAREVAARLGVSTETVLRWTRARKLPGFRMPGGALRYLDEELEAWLAERATSEPPGSRRRASAAGGRSLGRVRRRREVGGDQDAVDPTRPGVQARFW